MKRLQDSFAQLKNEYGLAALKGGTEVEDMTFNEIEFLNEASGRDLPVIIKIGGPEARNDIRAMKAIGVSGILAPMIESDYGLKNFIDSINDIYGDTPRPYLAINIETITSYYNLEKIYNSRYFRELDQITIGRSDLSASMNKKPDDHNVQVVTKDIVYRAQKMGKKTSVGGTVNPLNARAIVDFINPDRINTRHMVFDAQSCKDIYASVKMGLEVEMLLYEYFTRIEPSKKDAYSKRIKTTMERLDLADTRKTLMVG